jgi:hypothetical protein
MATNHSSKRPATTLRCGNIKATIWQNVSEKGRRSSQQPSLARLRINPLPAQRHLVRSP